MDRQMNRRPSMTTPTSRARRWGRLVKWTTTSEGSAELRVKRGHGTITLVWITPGAIEYATDLRPSEAALATIGWYKA